MSAALNFVGGIPFQLLYDGVKLGIHKAKKFRNQLTNLQVTLDGLQPHIIQEIDENNVQLNRPTETIRSLKTKVEEGKELVDKVLKLSMWNIRIWGNCFNCIGPDWAEQLSELDGSLRGLTARLEMEGKKNITDLLKKCDMILEAQQRLFDGQQRLNDLMMEQNKAPGKSSVWNDNNFQGVASSSGGGGGATAAPAVGVVFQQLFAITMEVNVKNVMFRRLIERFKSTLHCSQPLIEEIAKHNRILHLPNEEVKNLIRELKNGAGLVRKCSKIRKRANYRKNECVTKILSLNNSLHRLIIRLKLQVEKDVKETSDSADKMEAVIANIEAGSVVEIDDVKGHSPVERGSPGDVPRDVIKETSEDFIIDQKEIKPNEGSLQRSMDGKTLDSTDRIMEFVDSALKIVRDIDKKGVDKNEAAETEPPSLTVRDVPRNVLKAGDIKQIECEIATTEPSSLPSSNTKEAVLEHLKSREHARVKILKKWFPRNKSCGKRKKGNVLFWIIPSNCNKESKVSTFCSCIKPFQKHTEESQETEMIMKATFPYECIGNIIALTTPADACRLSLVSKSFKDEAESDQVWENFLPSPHLIHAIESQFTSSSTFVPAKSKKEFYFSLCDTPVLMDNGKMSFSLDKWSGKKCYMICARELNIVWAGDKRYWKWISLAESRFEEVAFLEDVCWLEIRGKIDMSILSPWTLYKAYLVYKFTERHYGFNVPVEAAIAQRPFGFEYGDLNAALGGDETRRIVYLDPSLKNIKNGAQHPKERADCWLEVELGEFLCQAEEDGELEMVCAGVKNLCWKSGLIVQGIEVRPGRKDYVKPEKRDNFEAKGKAGRSYFRAKGKKAIKQ